ncbi:tRNA lysidine(34) synthetase TilS [Terriglobus aquaticus]|uniref:tRNA(Ile)-lysidine synthase n=1 Tax=Terriglobus aquaticus TaxID=940139 RepID=A0ABW9KM13_9BACT|nr:tRNA lysidine(34) synthetase TilS [Terriglobus aquaticus]
MPKPISLQLNPALLPMGSRVCVAASGGADSTALLLALHEAATALGIGLSAAHLHHGIRGSEADADRDFVRALCLRLNLPLHEAEADVPATAAVAGEGLEEAARNARLGFFARLLGNGAADRVATAHTADDQAETVLMKLLRGAWIEGLGGIAPALPVDTDGRPCREGGVGQIVRPLLGATREQVIAFLKSRGQVWREDATNADPAFTRNRIRAELMPLLRTFNPGVVATLGATAELAREEDRRWQPEIVRVYQELAVAGRPVRGGGRAVSTAPDEQTVAFDLARLKVLDLPARRRLLRFAAERMGVPLNSAETARVLQLAGLAPPDSLPDPTVPSRPNSRLQLRDGLRAERSVRELRLSRG